MFGALSLGSYLDSTMEDGAAASDNGGLRGARAVSSEKPFGGFVWSRPEERTNLNSAANTARISAARRSAKAAPVKRVQGQREQNDFSPRRSLKSVSSRVSGVYLKEKTDTYEIYGII